MSKLENSTGESSVATCPPLLPGAEAEVVGELQELYYNNRDVRLMLELLATSSGLAPAIAVLTIFDKVSRYILVNSENMKYFRHSEKL